MSRIENPQYPIPLVPITHIGDTGDVRTPQLKLATSNTDKALEFARITGQPVIAIDVKADEPQSLDEHKVVETKARNAYMNNKGNEIFVDDTSLQAHGNFDLPGTLVTFYTDTKEKRKELCKTVKRRKDPSATAIVSISIFDGNEAHTRQGVQTGKIAKKPKGRNGFGWDDIFIPDGQKKKKGKKPKTFAQMSSKQKDKYSPRRKALEGLRDNPVLTGHYTWMMDEPYKEEMRRTRVEELQDAGGIQFAFDLEVLGANNPANQDFEAPNFNPVVMQTKNGVTRISSAPESPSMHLVITDADEKRLTTKDNGDVEVFQMGKHRRKRILIQRAEFFKKTQSQDIVDRVKKLESGKITVEPRTNESSLVIDELLKTREKDGKTYYLQAAAINELGYVKETSDKKVSRREVIAQGGLLHKVGKYPRQIIGLGSTVVSGNVDANVLVASADGVTFIARNNLLANEDRRIDVVKATMKKLENMPVSDDRKEMMKRNVGVAIGSDPVKDVDFVRKLVAETDCRMVRIYTINGDPRVVETAKKLREEFGDQLEIFVGQVTDIKQAIQLAEEAKVDGLIFGHGGGRQCTSGENGMAINTLEQIYDAVKEKKLNGTSIVVEGGVGTQLGGLIHLGVDCILYNNQIGKGCIEVSDLFLEHKKSKKKVHPYNGSASAPTMIIEESIGIERTSESGRTLDPEGKPGLMFYEEKAGTMAYWWFKFLGHAARVLVDYGVMSMEEFREKKKTRKGKEEIYRMVTAEAANKATAYGVAA